MKLFYLTLSFLFLSIVAFSQINMDNHNKAVDLIKKAESYNLEKKYQEAVSSLLEAIKLDSTIHAPYLMLFEPDYYLGQNDTTIKYLNKATKIFEEDDEICFYLGRTYQLKRDYLKAIKEYSSAIADTKKNGEDFHFVKDYYANRGICFLYEKKYNEALADFDYSIKLYPYDGSVFANRGITLYSLKKYKLACESWKKALKLGEPSVKKYLDKYCK